MNAATLFLCKKHIQFPSYFCGNKRNKAEVLYFSGNLQLQEPLKSVIEQIREPKAKRGISANINGKHFIHYKKNPGADRYL